MPGGGDVEVVLTTFKFQKSQKWCSSVRIMLLNKNLKYHKLVFTKEFIFCSNPKSRRLFVKCSGATLASDF